MVIANMEVEKEPQSAVYPLAMVGAGERVSIISFSAKKKMQQRLADMGLTVGSQVKVLKNDIGCPMLIAIGDTRVVLGQGMAQKIMACSET